MSSTLVSVIMPSYGHAEYIGDAIESVLNQTHSNLELIIIDDASKDFSWDCIQRFTDQRIKTYRNNANQGASFTLNEGIRAASGEYISILNSDDRYHPCRVERLLDLAETKGYEFLSTDIELLTSDEGVMRGKDHGWIEWFEGLKSLYASSNDPVLALLSGNLAASTSNFFFRADVPERIGYFYDYRYTHDYEFLLRYIADPESRFQFLGGDKLLNYRLHEKNTILESSLEHHRELFNLLTGWAADLGPWESRERMKMLMRHIRHSQACIESELKSNSWPWLFHSVLSKAADSVSRIRLKL